MPAQELCHTFFGLGRDVSAGVFTAKGLDLVEIKELDAPVVCPGTEDGRSRGDSRNGCAFDKRVHTDDGLEVGQLVRDLQQRGNMVAYFCLHEYIHVEKGKEGRVSREGRSPINVWPDAAHAGTPQRHTALEKGKRVTYH